MSRKEEIIYATLELASIHGLKAVSLSMIADKVGIKKPSLYNHFKSKEEIVSAMYVFLREQAKKNEVPDDLSVLFEGRTLEEILLVCLSGYMQFLTVSEMLCFFKVLYAERSTSPEAAQIMLEESDRMVRYTKTLFYALVVHGKMKNADIDTAALSYAMTIHSLVDLQMDRLTAAHTGLPETVVPSPELLAYIRWFSKQMEVTEHE